MEQRQDRQAAQRAAAEHRLVIEGRATLTVTGVQAVVSYDETGACLDTACGRLNIGGAHLSVGEVSVRTGEVRITGEIEYVQYTRARAENGPLWRRLFR